MKPNLHWSLLPAYHAEHLRPFIHPNLDRDDFLNYLFQTHIYPAKRVDYLGNPIVLPPKTEDADWVNDIKLNDHLTDLATN